MRVVEMILRILLGVEALLVAIVATAVTLYVFASGLIEGATRTVVLLDRFAKDLKRRSEGLGVALRGLRKTIRSERVQQVDADNTS